MSDPGPPIYSSARKRFPVWGYLLIACCGMCLVCMGVIVVPIFQSARVAATRSTALFNFRMIGTSVGIYAADNDDRFPPRMATGLEVKPYLHPYFYPGQQNAVFVTVNPAGGAVLGDRRYSSQPDHHLVAPATSVMFYDEKPWGRGAMACFADGHAQFKSSFADMLSSMKADPIDHSKDKPRSSR